MSLDKVASRDQRNFELGPSWYQGVHSCKLRLYCMEMYGNIGRLTIRGSFFDTIGHRFCSHLSVGFPRVDRPSGPVLCNDARRLLRGVAVEEAT